MKTLVVKLGGHALDDLSPRSPVLADLAVDVAELATRGERVIVVHGGGPQIAERLTRRGVPSSFVDGLRVTSDEVMEIVTEALLDVNTQLVASLNDCGLSAVGLSGFDGGLCCATPAGPPWGRVAVHPIVDARVVRVLVSEGFTPVVSSVVADGSGGALNCNADALAGALAAVFSSELILLSDIDQVRRNSDDADSALTTVSRRMAEELLSSGAAHDGMRPKLTAALDALDGGAPRVRLANGRRRHALRDVLNGAVASTEVHS